MLTHSLSIIHPQFLRTQNKPQKFHHFPYQNLINRTCRIRNDFHQILKTRAQIAIVFQTVTKTKSIQKNRKTSK